MARICAKTFPDLETSLCVRLRVEKDLYAPCPINHHIIMARGLYDFFWEMSQFTTCELGICGCKGDHNPMLCPLERCRVCHKYGHWDLICPEAGQHALFLTSEGRSPSFVTEYTQDLSKLKSVRMMCSLGIYQLFFPIAEEIEDMVVDEFYQNCSKTHCSNCGKVGNPMVCKCAPKRKCPRCRRIHHTMFCGAFIPNK